MDDASAAFPRRPPVRIDAFRCLRVRHHLAECAACREACPREAIALAPGPAIDAGRCDGCGVCAAVCPTGALELRALSPAALLAETGGSRVEFSCRHSSVARGAQVPCLGFLDAGTLLAAAASGADVALEAGPCAHCPGRRGLEAAERAAAAANAVLAALGYEPRVAFRRRDAYVAALGVSRRGLFGFVRQKAREHLDADPEAPATPVAKGKAIRGALRPLRRSLLVQAIGRLRTGQARPDAQPPAGGALPFFDLALSAACDNCGMCLTFCPTAALRAERGRGRATFVFSPDLCLGCAVCVAVCPRRAVSLARATSLPAPGATRSLLARALRCCVRCGTEYPAVAGETLCPQCAQKQSLEDAIRRTLFG